MKFLLVFLISLSSYAGLYLRPSGTYSKDVEEDANFSVEQTETHSDVSLGFLWNNGFFLGGILTLQEEDIETQNKVTGSSTTSTLEWANKGVLLGYLGKKNLTYHFAVGYFFDAEYTNGSNNIYTGNGLLAEVGMYWKVQSTYLGLLLTYRALSYDTFDDGSGEVELSTPLEKSILQPMLTIWWTL